MRISGPILFVLLSMLVWHTPGDAQESHGGAAVEAVVANPSVDASEEDKNDGDGSEDHRRRHGHMGLDPETRALLEEVMVARLSKQLALDDEATVVLVRKFSDFRDEVFASRKQRVRILRQLRAELKDAQDSNTIETLLAQMLAEDEKTFQSRKSFFEHIGEDLTPWQRGRLYVFLSEFEMDMRRLIEKARGHRSEDDGDGKKGRSGDKTESPDADDTAEEPTP